ncbi:hypothetical protein ABZT43_48130, partial [Streptomyces sp. NPDC005349]
MKPSGVELLRVQMPLVAPFRTSFGTQDVRELLLVRVVTPNGEGWGECVTMGGPLYSSEYVDGAEHVLRNFLVPALMEAGEVTASRVAPLLARSRCRAGPSRSGTRTPTRGPTSRVRTRWRLAA